jgi:hypothetical protein
MQFKLRFSEEAKEKKAALELDKSKKGLLKQLNKVLGLMETNLRHPFSQYPQISWNDMQVGRRI